jgi:Caulimovirus viroplasmin
MARKRKFYAVARGHESALAPCITTSWYASLSYRRRAPCLLSRRRGVAGALTSGCSQSKHKSFTNFHDAVKYMRGAGLEAFYFLTYHVDGGVSAGGENTYHPTWYAVANGRETNIYKSYT